MKILATEEMQAVSGSFLFTVSSIINAVFHSNTTNFSQNGTANVIVHGNYNTINNYYCHCRR